MAARGSDAGDLPPGPGLARRWRVTLPCVLAGILLPIVLADALAIGSNAVSRAVDLPRVAADFTPAVALWSGLPLVAGLVAVLVTRREVLAWPRIGALVTAPSLAAMAVVGVVAGPLFWLGVPLAALLGFGGFLLVRLGVRRLVERPGADTLGTGLDVVVPLGGADHLLLHHDRMVAVVGTDRWAVSWYDVRTVRAGASGVEVLATGGRRRALPAEDVALVVAAVRLRFRWVRRHPSFAARRDEHRRAHGTRTVAASRPRSSRAPGTGIGTTGLTVLFMAVMPVSAIVLVFAAVHANPADRPPMVIGVVASVVIGVWAHVRFWRRRAAQRYLSAHPDA